MTDDYVFLVNEKFTDNPGFTAYEINELSKRARKSGYYKKCRTFVLDTIERPSIVLTGKQLKWLYAIKADLREE